MAAARRAYVRCACSGAWVYQLECAKATRPCFAVLWQMRDSKSVRRVEDPTAMPL